MYLYVKQHNKTGLKYLAKHQKTLTYIVVQENIGSVI